MSLNSPEFMEQTAMVQFVKIIERFPDIYDHNLETYRRWSADKAWEKVVETVKTEMNMECTMEELKSKWKGIRSSFNRYRNKFFTAKRKGNTFYKKYYLYDALQFLEPFSKPKELIMRRRGVTQNAIDDDDEGEEQESVSENDSTWIDIKIKEDPSETNETDCFYDTDEHNVSKNTDSEDRHRISKKRKLENNKAGEENDNIHFFKSILPDIAHFTAKEKRKLKIGILKLIDDIENKTSKKRKARSDSSSS